MPTTIELLKDNDPDVRRIALGTLGQTGAPAKEAAPVLVDLLKDNDPDIRRMAVQILGRMGAPVKEAVPLIVGMLHDKDWHFRSVAANALGQIGPEAKPAVASLTASLKDMDGDVRVCAIEALGRIGPEAQAATAGLIERLHDDHPSVRSAAARPWGRSAPGQKRLYRSWRSCGTIRKITSGRRPTRHWGRLRETPRASRGEGPDAFCSLPDPIRPGTLWVRMVNQAEKLKGCRPAILFLPCWDGRRRRPSRQGRKLDFGV